MIKKQKQLLYFLILIVIYLLFKSIPSNKLPNNDLLIISAITTLLCICFYNSLFNSNEHFDTGLGFEINLFNNKDDSNDNVEQEADNTEQEADNTEQEADNTEQEADNTEQEAKKESAETDESNNNIDIETKKSVNNDEDVKLNEDTQEITNTKQSLDTIVARNESTIQKPEVPIQKPESSISVIPKIEQTEITNMFPFTFEYISEIFNNFLKAKNDDNMAKQLFSMAKKYKPFELLIQIFQTNIEASYKFMNKNDYNKINDIIYNLISKQPNTTNQTNKFIDNNGFYNQSINSDTKYTMYTHEQNQKLGTYDDTFNNQWENDYVLLNTDKWRPPISHSMYKCKTETTCPVCPSLTSGYPVRLKDFNNARKILPPDIINVDYINDRLLTGL